MAERLMEAVKRDGEKPAIERWNALIERGAIDTKGRVLLKAPRPMAGAGAKRKGVPKPLRKRRPTSRRRLRDA